MLLRFKLNFFDLDLPNRSYDTPVSRLTISCYFNTYLYLLLMLGQLREIFLEIIFGNIYADLGSFDVHDSDLLGALQKT